MIEKEAQVWHMDTLRHKEELFQCTICGNIHKDYSDEIIDLDNDVYYATVCGHCRGVTKHLWIGSDESEQYALYDPVLDSRYY